MPARAVRGRLVHLAFDAGVVEDYVQASVRLDGSTDHLLNILWF